MTTTLPGDRGPHESRLVGIVLAAGAGRRAGGPKALRRTDDGAAWLGLAESVLGAADCRDLVVVLGASADEARGLVSLDAEVVVAQDWEDGLSASLRAGLAAAQRTSADAAMVTLVDLPTMPSQVAVELHRAAPVDAATLRRAAYNGEPGHPVIIGRDHWTALAATLEGDRGAGPYLRAHHADTVELGHLWSGEDQDT